MNGLSVCLDEIALEGLDGITLSTLWRRIDSATLCSTVDENYKEFLWRCVSSCQDIEAYLLETPRAEILDFADDSQIYPYYCINEAGVRGSCATFKTRSLVDISSISLQTAVETYGNRLVLVASQLLRNKVLLGPEFDISVKIPETCYCLLEMIGRGRKLGRLQSNLGLQTMVDSRSLFSQVKTLLKLQLITKQSVVVPKRNIPSAIIYLPRYHTEHGYDSIPFKISKALSEAPDCRMQLESLCLLLEEEREIVESVVEELSHSGHVQYVNINHSDARSCDNAGRGSDIMSSTDSSEGLYDTQGLVDSEDMKVVMFVHHFHNMCVEDDNEFEDEEWAQPEKQELSMSIPAELPVMHAIYHLIASKGTQGASLTQCCQELSFPFFNMRKILKDMECLQVLFCKFQDVGNTKKNMYFARSKLTQGQGNTQLSQTSGALHGTLATEITQPIVMQTTETTHPYANPKTQGETYTTTQITEDQMSHITQSPASQVPHPLTAEITQPSAACSTRPSPIQTASTSTAQITKPQTVSHPLISQTTIPQGFENTIVATNEDEHEVLQNLEANIINDTPQLPSVNVNDTTTKTKKSVRSHSQKIIDSEKFIRRKKIIFNVLNNLKVVEGRNLFARFIRIEEKKMGLSVTVDSRSVLFLLDRLTADGLLKRVKMNVKVDDEEHKVEFFYDVSIQDNSEEIASCVQNFKDRITIQKAKRSGILEENKTTVTSTFLPKMPRVELLHTFLFYVIYELSNPNVDLEVMRRKYAWTEHLKLEHVPKKIGDGWFTPFSILLLLPVSLYFKLVDASFHNRVVREYFDNPATRHMLLKDLPSLARQILFDNRRSHFLFGSFEFLAYLGLITPTTKQMFFHERDIACYLHTSTVVMDTRESEPSYDKVKHPNEGDFPEMQFSFTGMADVEQYWDTVRTVCMTTPLNKGRKPHDSKSRKYTTFESLVVDLKEVPTCSKPRGDGLGAAGFDSCLYAHLQNKWKWSLVEKQAAGLDSDVEDALDWQLCFTNDLLSESVASVGKKKAKRKREKPAEDESVKKKRNVSDEKKTDVSHHGTQCSSAQQNTSTDQNNCSASLPKNVDKGKKKQKKRKRKKKKLESKINTKAKSKSHGHWSKHVHDKRDEEALKQLQAKRNTFTPQQQKLLFICCLALRIIGKKSVDTGYSDWLWTRDILYKDNYESAKTKTALSICRKYRSMVKNAQTKTNLDICVADCMQEKEFQPYCNIGKNCNEAMFNELVELLKKKYSMENMVSNRLVLPSSMQEFRQQKNLYNSLEVENSEKCDEDILSLEPRETSVADIRQRIIRDSIVSALLLNNASYQAHVAFRFLSQFTEEELIIAISLLKNGRIVVRKKLRYAKKGLDLASCAFSQMLSTHGQRIIENHFPSSLLDDAKSFYDKIAGTSESLEFVESSERFLPLKFSDSSIDGGKVCCIFSLLASQRLAVNMEVPDIFLALAKRPNSKKSKPVAENVDEELCDEVSNETIEECSSLSMAHASNHNDPSEIRKNGEDKTPKETCGSLEPENKERNPNNGKDGPQPSTISSVETLENTNVIMTVDEGTRRSTTQITKVQNEDEFPVEERVPIPGNINRKRSNDMVLDVLCGIEDHLFGSLDLESNTPLYRVNLKPTSKFTCSMTTSDIDSVRASGGNHVVLRNVETSSLRDKNIYESYLEKIATYQRTGDLNRIYFSINPCSIEVRLLPISEVTSTPNVESLVQSVAHHFKSNGLKLPETIEECVKVCSNMFGYSNKDCEALSAVYETINSSKEIGMSSSSINKIVRTQHSIVSFSTDGLIKVLEAFNLVYQVGFVEVCYVAKAFKNHWFLNVWEGDVTPSSEIRSFEKEQTSGGKRKRSVSQEETNHGKETKSGEESGLLENGQQATTPSTPERTLSCKTRSRTSRSRTFGEQKSKKTGNSKKQASTETQTDSYSSKPCRPWITMTGEINKNAYNTLHRSVLAYIIKYPGIQKYAITKHFVNLVYPVTVDDILQKLEECGCIVRCVCYIKKETLFSSKAGSKSSYYLSKPDAIFKLMERVFQ